MISLTNIRLRYGDREVLKGVNLNIRDGECLAIVGPNGCGKSTLLRIIAKMEQPDSGEVVHPNRLTLGHLPQEANLDSSRTLETELLSSFAEVQDALSEMAQIEHAMAYLPHDSPEYERLLRRYAEASHCVEHGDGYQLEAKVRRVAAGLGFRPEDLRRPCREFSGGWQMRILLAKLLLRKPDVLLLDEPTNHLDLETMLWLEEWIRTGKRTVVMVSHERAFMDRLAHRIVCLEQGTAEVYPGDYSHYVEQSALKREALWKAYEHQQREIAAAEAFIRKFRYNAARAPQVQSRIKLLDKIERLEPPFHPTAIHFDFPPAPPSYRDVLTLRNVGHRYGDLRVFSNVNLIVTRGEKIGLVGVNGAGKSTLLRILAGRERPTEGEVVVGGNVSIAYFAQYDLDRRNSSQTVLQAIEAAAPLGQASRARDVLGAFLFTGDDVEKPLSVLSGGERTRFRLAEMLFSPANLLLLDEPTNHLDITSRATVEDALQSYTGTVIVVSHDRVFMDKVTNRILEIEDGRVSTFPGTYSDYLLHKQMMVEREGLTDNGDADPSPAPARPGRSKEQRLLARERQKARARKVHSLARKIAALESQIAAQEARLAELDRQMAAPAVASDYSRLAPLMEERLRTETDLRRNLDQWENLQQELMALQSS